MPNPRQSQILGRITHELRNLGYEGELLQENYAFADFLDPEYSVKRIDLAAFTQEPLSYRHASFGVVVANGTAGAELIEGQRSLGAPQIFEVANDQVVRWKVTSTGAPSQLERVSADQIPGMFAAHKADWNPSSVRQARSGSAAATQLDFFDLGLLPLLDYEVRTKLDRLLGQTVRVATDAYKKTQKLTDKDYPPLFRMIFRLVAAKVLADRQHPGEWLPEDPRSAIAAVEDFYFRSDHREPVLEDRSAQEQAWNRIRSGLHFQNLSVDSLAYVYENTLVSPGTRRLFGIHSTPREVAEYIVDSLPFEHLDQDERRVFEPFSGHSVFLIAAMRRLRDLLPVEMDSHARHEYFVQMLCGMEFDDFAREVAKLSLMLADYPNPDGWRLIGEDVFAAPAFEKELEAANIVLCNPPFERFGTDGKARYPDIVRQYKPAEMLHRVLQRPPRLLGLVLPRTFLDGDAYREVRRDIGRNYSSVEVVEMADKLFLHSDAETVLVTASGEPSTTVHVRSSEVIDREAFYATRNTSNSSDATLADPVEAFAGRIGLLRLPAVWEATAHMKRLGDAALIHRGIEYNIAFRGHEAELVATEQRAGFAPGLRGPRGTLEPFAITNHVFLNVNPDLLSNHADVFPWHEPKIIVNAIRRSRGAWKLSAAIDRSGLVCYQNLHGISLTENIPLEVVTAVLNGPVANAFMSVRESSHHVRIGTLNSVPVPDVDRLRQDRIVSLAKEYAETRSEWIAGALNEGEAHDLCLQLLLQIDAEVLLAYDLPLRVEHELLDYFHGQSRTGPVEFTGYMPLDFRPHFPLHMHVSGAVGAASAVKTLTRLPSIPRSPLLDEALAQID